MDQLTHALLIATLAHDGQKYGEMPYIFHPIRVALALLEAGASETLAIAGLLHDMIEDTDWTVDRIESEFGTYVSFLVEDLTKKDGDSYDDYIEQMPPECRIVKFFDSLDNYTHLDFSDLDPDRKARLKAKYAKTLIRLGDTILAADLRLPSKVGALLTDLMMGAA